MGRFYFLILFLFFVLRRGAPRNWEGIPHAPKRSGLRFILRMLRNFSTTSNRFGGSRLRTSERISSGMPICFGNGARHGRHCVRIAAEQDGVAHCAFKIAGLYKRDDRLRDGTRAGGIPCIAGANLFQGAAQVVPKAGLAIRNWNEAYT